MKNKIKYIALIIGIAFIIPLTINNKAKAEVRKVVYDTFLFRWDALLNTDLDNLMNAFLKNYYIDYQDENNLKVVDYNDNVLIDNFNEDDDFKVYITFRAYQTPAMENNDSYAIFQITCDNVGGDNDSLYTLSNANIELIWEDTYYDVDEYPYIVMEYGLYDTLNWDIELVYCELGNRSNDIDYGSYRNPYIDGEVISNCGVLSNYSQICFEYSSGATQQEINQYKQEGRNEVINNPNSYDLYNESQYENNYNNGYSEGVAYQKAISGESGKNFFVTIFEGLGSFFAIELFPGISFGLIIGVPFVISIAWVVIRLFRGGGN